MGTDKGLLSSAEGTWAQTAIDKMTALPFPIVLSVNTSQYLDYAAIFPFIELIADNPGLPLAGPLLGLLTIHQQKPAEDLLILACDMPLIQSLHLQHLVDQYRRHPGFDAYVFTNDGAFEPLCALYTARGLSILMNRLNHGELNRFSMKYALEQLNTFSIPIPDDHKIYFKNLNSPKDVSPGDVSPGNPGDLGPPPPPGQIPSSL